ADLRLAVQRLISSSIVMLMSVISTHYDLSRISVGHYIQGISGTMVSGDTSKGISMKQTQTLLEAAGFKEAK
ncbi:hypothetical protein QQF47_21155, partial [Salmonella enterica subsp. enterica serovar Give]|nr:hypothetical protein [Salmonella enterica subsp. enterica serovar Give]